VALHGGLGLDFCVCDVSGGKALWLGIIKNEELGIKKTRSAFRTQKTGIKSRKRSEIEVEAASEPIFYFMGGFGFRRAVSRVLCLDSVCPNWTLKVCIRPA
jgi:hypothetical protein